MTRTLIPLVALGLFAAMASYSLGKFVSRDWHPPAVNQPTLGEFAAGKLSEYRPPSRPVYVWRDAKAASIADVWNLTPESLDSPVDILGRRR